MHNQIFSSALSFSKYSSEPRDLLQANGFNVSYNEKGRPLTEQELIASLQGVSGVILGLDPLTEQVIKHCNQLKLICKHGVGIDNIDLVAAKQAGILVTNVPDGNYNAVADLTFGLILSGVRKILQADQIVRDGRWNKVVGNEIWEKTLGVVGTGRIGLGVCRRGKGFNMRIKAFDICPNQDAADRYGFDYVPLDDLLSTSDIVSLHLPLTKETRSLINTNTLSRMKRGAFLVNTARGELIDETALCEALKSERLSGAALDAFCEEPPANSPLLQSDRVVLTPHIGAYSYEANHRMGMGIVRNLIKFFNNEQPDNIVG